MPADADVDTAEENQDAEGSDDAVVDAEIIDVAEDEPVGVDLVDGATESGDGESETVDADSEPSLAQQRDEYLNALRQVQADFENFRKRSFKQQGEAIDRATGRLVEDLLVVLDACDAGIEHGDEGVTAVFTALVGVLEKAGLERLDPVGETFDPNAHEAVLHEPSDEDDDAGAEPRVVEVMRTGYRWKERTLRAAMVKVRG